MKVYSKNELIQWLNNRGIKITRLDSLKTGVQLGRLVQTLLPYCRLHKMNSNPKYEYQFIENFRHIEQAIVKLGFRPLQIQKLVKGRIPQFMDLLNTIRYKSEETRKTMVGNKQNADYVNKEQKLDKKQMSKYHHLSDENFHKKKQLPPSQPYQHQKIKDVCYKMDIKDQQKLQMIKKIIRDYDNDKREIEIIIPKSSDKVKRMSNVSNLLSSFPSQEKMDVSKNMQQDCPIGNTVQQQVCNVQ